MPDDGPQGRHFTQAERSVLDDILRWRRDVRHFRPDPIAEDQIDRLRRAMEAAPSVGNARPWRVLRVRDGARRAAVERIFEDCNAEAAEGYAGDDRTTYLALKLAGLREAPEHLAVFTDTAPPEGRGLGRQTMPETLMHSTAMAIHTLWLAARAENLGLGWVSILDPAAICALFEVPETWRFTGYLCLGAPAFHDDTPLLHRLDWQADTATTWQDV